MYLCIYISLLDKSKDFVLYITYTITFSVRLSTLVDKHRIYTTDRFSTQYTVASVVSRRVASYRIEKVMVN